jgi:hypothetical protein
MTTTRHKIERWGAGILGVVCLFLVWKIVFSNGLPMSAARPVASNSAAGNRARASGAAQRDDLERYNPELKLDDLKQIEGQPLPKLTRNPFEYPPPPAPPRLPMDQANAETTPPPPPPLPLKAIGYSVRANGVPEAVVTDDTDIFVVHAGETFAKRFRVLSLTSSRVEIEDVNTHQVAQLPIAP